MSADGSSDDSAGDVDGNLYARIPASLPQELAEILCQQPGVRIERIVSRGHCSPPGVWYDQPEQEFVLLLRGAARLQFAATAAHGAYSIELSPADHLLIPAHQRHRVSWTAAEVDTVWLAVFFGGESDDEMPRA